MAAFAAFQEKLTRENQALHAKSQLELLATQRESNAQLLAAQKSVVEEQRKSRELQDQLNIKLLETQLELEALKLAAAQEAAKAARLQAEAIDKQKAWEAEK